jgi:hypothetical protein
MFCNIKTKFVFLFKDMKGMKVVMNGMNEQLGHEYNIFRFQTRLY